MEDRLETIQVETQNGKMLRDRAPIEKKGLYASRGKALFSALFLLLLLIIGVYMALEPKSTHPPGFPYPSLLSNQEGKYRVLEVVNQAGDVSELKREDIQKMLAGSEKVNFRTAEKDYPLLSIKKSPDFLVFDTKGVVFQADQVQAVYRFLKKASANR